MVHLGGRNRWIPKLKASLVYRASSNIALHRETLSWEKKKGKTNQNLSENQLLRPCMASVNCDSSTQRLKQEFENKLGRKR